MNKSNSTFAFASYDQWVGGVLLRTPTNSALNLVFRAFILDNILDTFDLLSFLEFLVIELSFAHHDLIALEIFYSEAHSSKFDGVKFLNLVIVFSGFIFERPGDKPESIYAFFFLSSSSSCMVKVVSFCIFLKKTETTCVRTLLLINHVIWLIEVNLIIVSYYLTLRLGFQTHFNDVP